MKKFIILFILITINANAQKELWGTTTSGNFQQGNIVKFDMNGENAINTHVFNSLTGKIPEGKLLLASNGKLYGTARYGGTNDYGVIYEYDLTFDTYRVVHYFNGILAAEVTPTSGLIEPIPGKLYGGTAYGGFYVYDIATETVTILNHTYSFVAMGGIFSDLIKASNGFLYAVSNQSFPCTSPGSNQPNQGSIVKINTTTNTAQRITTFNCDGSNGIGGGSNLVEALPNRIFFTSSGSPVFFPDGNIAPAGTIIEFNTLTNILVARVLFDFTNGIGAGPRSLILNDIGNLYAVCLGGGDTYRANLPEIFSNKTGTIFEYNPTTNVITKLTDIAPDRFAPNNLIKLSTGDYMGNFSGYGLFKYVVNTNSLQLPNLVTYSDLGSQGYAQNLIEICRKPSYHFFDVNTFDTCAGGNFTYDIQNTNATTYQWLKNGNNVSNQTTGVLNLTNLVASDAGNYTCLMTNECGTTTTMVLHLTVNCLGTATFADLEKSIKLYANPTKDILNIKLPENITVTINNIKIANSLGQIIREQKIQNNHIIDVSQLQNGIYFISLTTNYGDWNGKFVKE